MLLSRIDITNFRGLHALALDVDAVTAIVGENNSGKTSLLDALSLVLGTAGAGVTFEPRDFHRGDDGATASRLRLAFSFSEGTPGAWQGGADGPRIPTRGRDALGRRHALFVVTAAKPGAVAPIDVACGFVRDGEVDPVGLDLDALATVRRLSPLIRLRANRSVEEDPRDEVPAPVAPPGTDPVVWQVDRQFGLMFRALTGRTELGPDEFQRSLDAAVAFLAQVDPQLRSFPVVSSWQDGGPADIPVRLGRRPGLGLSAIKEGTGVRAVALLAVIGAWLSASGGHPLAPGADAVIVMEDAEAHLHPIALSAMWALVEAIRAQKILTTNSGELLASVPLGSLRRLARDGETVRVHRVDPARYSADDRRRIAYHVRVNRAGALFARSWLLVEGETEAWLVPEFARACGYDLPTEGVRCVEFAQCGLRPLVKLARDLGIDWHVLSDGDAAGRAYASAARGWLEPGEPEEARLTALDAPDMEHFLWANGYAAVFERAVSRSPDARHLSPARVIRRAIRARSKPTLALDVAEAISVDGGPGVPPLLRRMIERVVARARGALPVARSG